MNSLAVLAGVSAAAALLVGGSTRTTRRQRVARLRRPRVVPGGAGTSGEIPVAVAGVAGVLAVTMVTGGAAGPVVVAGVAATACWAAVRARAGPARREATTVAAMLPRTADLLAACLQAGASPVEALELVGPVLGGPVHTRLRAVAAAVRLGSDPAQAWQVAGPALAPLARAFGRAARTGAPLAETVVLVADEQRRALRWAAEAAARRAGVRAVGPLAVCFLPAFVLVGVVPVVLSVAGDLVDGLR